MSKISAIEILSKNTFENLLSNDFEYEKFHEKTKLNKFKEKLLGKNITKVVTNPIFIEASVNSSFSFSTTEKIPLPPNFLSRIDIKKDFRDVIFSRRSTRSFSSYPMTLDELTYVLNSSYGISGEIVNADRNYYQELRTSPSAGGLYPLEIYFYANNISSLEKGIYHYNPIEHELSVVRKGEVDLKNLTSYSEIGEQSACIFFITAVFPRLSYKYGERSYRFIHLDAGHLGQNFYLSAESINLGTVAIGGFFDDEINQMLNVDGITEGVVYEFFLGHK